MIDAFWLVPVTAVALLAGSLYQMKRDFRWFRHALDSAGLTFTDQETRRRLEKGTLGRLPDETTPVVLTAADREVIKRVTDFWREPLADTAADDGNDLYVLLCKLRDESVCGADG